jgi:hypothetical protein
MTLNQIVSRVRSLALSHKMVRTFRFGGPDEFLANGEVVYGACFVELLNGSDSRVTKLKTYNLRFYFLDRVHVSEEARTNETEVLSDMASVGDDMLAMLRYYDDWEIGDNSSFLRRVEFTEDEVAGFSLDVSVSVESLSDRCQVPAEDVTFETDFDMARTKIIPYTASGSEGDSFTVSDISGKIVLGAFRAGPFKKVSTSLPSDSDTIKVAGTDLGLNKGILATGSVGLQTGDGLVSGEQLNFLVWAN